MTKNKLSIKDIANLSGVSVATVSRVINQNGRFSKETEKRVLEVIEKYSYHPNELARGLRSDKAQIVGVIVPDITNSFFSQISRKIEKELLKYGYMSIICDTNENETREQQYMEMLFSMRVQGIIYIGGTPISTQIESIPIVYVDRAPVNKRREPGACFIGSNNTQGGYLATDCLIRRGKKNIAIVIREGMLDHINVSSRLEGYRKALQEHRISYEKERIFKVEQTSMEEGYEVTRRICEEYPEVDGIFYYTDLLAIGGMRYLQEKKIAIPKQIAVVGLDDIPASSMMTPSLTTVRQSREEFANLAVKAIIDRMNGVESQQKYILDVELVERESTMGVR